MRLPYKAYIISDLKRFNICIYAGQVGFLLSTLINVIRPSVLRMKLRRDQLKIFPISLLLEGLMRTHVCNRPDIAYVVGVYCLCSRCTWKVSIKLSNAKLVSRQ